MGGNLIIWYIHMNINGNINWERILEADKEGSSQTWKGGKKLERAYERYTGSCAVCLSV